MKEFVEQFFWRIVLVFDSYTGVSKFESTILDVLLGLVNLFIVLLLLYLLPRLIWKWLRRLVNWICLVYTKRQSQKDNEYDGTE